MPYIMALTLNVALISSGSIISWMKTAKLNVFVKKIDLSTESVGLSRIWNNVAAWSNPKYLFQKKNIEGEYSSYYTFLSNNIG